GRAGEGQLRPRHPGPVRGGSSDPRLARGRRLRRDLAGAVRGRLLQDAPGSMTPLREQDRKGIVMSHAEDTVAVNANPPARPEWAGPRGSWLLGCMRQFQRDPLTLYTRANREFGHYVRIRAFPGIHVYLLTHPEAVEHVLQKNHKNYRKPDFFN